jgi:hypothetical protein
MLMFGGAAISTSGVAMIADATDCVGRIANMAGTIDLVIVWRVLWEILE